MKTKLLVGFVAVVALATITKTLITPEDAKAEAMAKAQAAIQQDAEKTVKQIEKTNTTVKQIMEDAERNDKPALSKDATNLTKDRAELKEIQSSLSKDSEAYANARDQHMTEINSHVEQVTDPVTHRQLQRLVDRTARNATRKIEAAKAAISEIDHILGQADDIAHIAKVIALTDRVDDGGRDLDVQIGKAKTASSLYTQRASTLISQITNTLAQQVGD